MVNISDRMKKLCDYVEPGAKVCDVGCDHGFVSIYLVQNSIANSALAMDVRKGPLSRAEENIIKYAVNDKITTRLSDGLKKYATGEADTLIIAGMGGPLMEKILTEGKEFWSDFSNVILEPQSEIPEFRHFLTENGFEIMDEDIIRDEGKFYFFIQGAFKDAASDDYYKELDFYVGKKNLERKKSVLIDYLNVNLGVVNSILEKLMSSPESEARNRKISQLEAEKKLILEALT